jgi:hypothetical protein
MTLYRLHYDMLQPTVSKLQCRGPVNRVEGEKRWTTTNSQSSCARAVLRETKNWMEGSLEHTQNKTISAPAATC